MHIKNELFQHHISISASYFSHILPKWYMHPQNSFLPERADELCQRSLLCSHCALVISFPLGTAACMVSQAARQLHSLHSSASTSAHHAHFLQNVCIKTSTLNPLLWETNLRLNISLLTLLFFFYHYNQQHVKETSATAVVMVMNSFQHLFKSVDFHILSLFDGSLNRFSPASWLPCLI